MMAMSIGCLPVLVCLFFQRYFIAGMTAGSVKVPFQFIGGKTMLMNMKDLLAVARNGFAVPAFSISSNMLLKGVMKLRRRRSRP
jgi:hypothetical protein